MIFPSQLYLRRNTHALSIISMISSLLQSYKQVHKLNIKQRLQEGIAFEQRLFAVMDYKVHAFVY